jgi:hypothetical protein
MAKHLIATFSHPLCGCVNSDPIKVEITGDSEWPEIQCQKCGCRFRSSKIIVQDLEEYSAALKSAINDLCEELGIPIDLLKGES